MYSQFFNPFSFWQNAMTNYTNKVTKLAMETADKTVKHNLESGQHYVETATKHMGALMSSQTPEDFLKIQSAWMKDVFTQIQEDTKVSMETLKETSANFNKITKETFSPTGAE